MLGILGWGFAYFIFIKIFCSIAYREPLSMIAALLITICISFVEMLASLAYANLLGQYLARMRLLGKDDGYSLIKILGIWILTLIPNFVVAVFITIGFSERFYRYNLYGHRDLLNFDRSVPFFSAIAIMTFANVLVFVIGAKLRGRMLRDDAQR